MSKIRQCALCQEACVHLHMVRKVHDLRICILLKQLR
nr:MAG TPA: hypothetical protein [Caudoviricetes sp.]